MSSKLAVLFIILSFCFINGFKSQILSSISNRTIANDINKISNIETTNSNNNKELSSDLINNLVKKCSSMISLDSCDMCSLCQNGAFCKQRVSKKNPQQQQEQQKALLNYQKPLNKIDSLAILRSLVEFTCYCVPGYTGTYCQIDINECLSNPCTNNSTCIDHINAYECKCPLGFAGEHCEININECESIPCQNGGKCVDLIDGYYCQCPTGFTGSNCDININDCESAPCLNGAKCVDLINGYECNCTKTGFEGKHCETNIDDCLNVKCKHNSTCTDLINGFKCNCHQGYQGKYCEVDINECKSNPCLNGAQCWQNSDRKNYDRKSKYLKTKSSSQFNYQQADGFWCECKPGYTGANCEITINECESNPCGYNGMCIDLINEFKCVCYPGFTGKTCMENVNECTYKPCASETKCIDLKPDYQTLIANLYQQNKLNISNNNENSNVNELILDFNHKSSVLISSTDRSFIYTDGYKCDCTELNEELFKSSGTHDVIYAGQNCSLKLNSCETMRDLCKHGSKCKSILTINDQQDIECECLPGYMGKYCQYVTTFNLDGSYAINHTIEQNNENDLDIKFEFRVNFFHKYQHKLPLMYFQSTKTKNELAFEINILREYLHIKNLDLSTNEKLPFYFNYSNSNNNDDTNLPWHSLQIKYFKSNNSVEIIYECKQIQLLASKVIMLSKNLNKIDSFTIGKYYTNRTNNVNRNISLEHKYNNFYLSGACFRDFNLNKDILFKKSENNEKNTQIKYGCQPIENKCLAKKDNKFCQNNAICVYKFYDHECIKCKLPNYGRYCQFTSKKLAFINPNTMDILNSEIQTTPTTNNFNYYYSSIRSDFVNNEPVKQPYLMLSNLMRLDSTSFKIQFKFNRIFSNNNKTPIKQFTFLLLKQKNSNKNTNNYYYDPYLNRYNTKLSSHNYYLIGINQEGYLEMKKIQSDYDLNDFDYNMLNKYKTLWSLKNEKINLNAVETSYEFKFGLKFNQKFVELSINGTKYLSRFELINNNIINNNNNAENTIEIETIIFSCFDSTFYSQRNDMTFLVHDLTINDYFYEFQGGSSKKSLKLIILDGLRNFLTEEEDNEENINKMYLLDHSYLDLFDYSFNDVQIVEQLNENNNYCKPLRKTPMNETIYTFDKKQCYLTNYMKINFLPSQISLPQSNLVISVKNSQLNNNKNSYNELKNISCHMRKPSRIQSINNNYYHNMAPNDYQASSLSQSTCQKYSTIQRNIINSNTENSYINYYFDFDETGTTNYHTSTNNNNISTLYEQDEENISDIDLLIKSPLTKQRRLILYKDVEFYSIGFNLNLNKMQSSLSNIQNDTIKFNLFTLNTFDDLTTNRIFLFGLNCYLTSNQSNLTTQFEIFTNKQSINATLKSINLSSIYLNVTFTFNSIELRFDKRDEYAVRLTDRYFNLFFRSLLKAYGSFQLNITTDSIGSTSKTPAISACITNFILVTRRPYFSTNLTSTVSYAYDFYNLIDQTKSISYYQAKFNEILFDKCGGNFNSSDMRTSSILNNNSGLSRIMMSSANSSAPAASTLSEKPNCYLISKFDVKLNQKLNDFYDCNNFNCTKSNCSYLFWSLNDENDETRSGRYSPQMLTNQAELAYTVASSFCNNTKDLACFNNGLCVDTVLPDSNNILIQPEPNYKCICQDGYVGKRCEEYDPCSLNPCSPDSTCTKNVIESTNQITYQCKCNPGFLGRNCTININDTCLASPCRNGATCLNVTNLLDNEELHKLTYECMCTHGYEGKQCENRIDYCGLYEPCSNGAKCVNVINGQSLYKCSCSNGWKGINCTQDVDECTQMRNKFITPCSGNGKCINTPGASRCECNNYYYGDNCEFNHVCQTIDDLSSSSPCKNGGFCEIIGELFENRYECKCMIGYSGQNCTHPTCDLQLCKHESTCSMINDEEYECNCTGTGHIGRNCETLINEPECRQTACFGNQTCDPLKCDCDMINCDEIYQHMKSRPKDLMYHLILWPLLGIMLALLIILFSIFIMKMKKSRATRGTYSPSRHEQQASRIEFNMDLKRPPEERLI